MSQEAYPQLDAIAASLGRPPSGASFSLRHQGAELSVSLEIDSGSVRGLMLVAATPPVPKLALTRETGFERFGKALGINREIQVGDASFDAQVYIDDEETSEEAARRLLAPPLLRRAVQALLAQGCTVDFGAEGVTLRLREGERRDPYDPRLFHALLPPLLGLLAALPRFASGEAATPLPAPLPEVVSLDELRRLRPAPAVSWAARLALGAFVLLLIFGWMAATVGYTSWWRPVDTFRSVALGLGAGVLVWLLALPVVSLAVRGKPSSLQSLLILHFVLGTALVPAGMGALWIYNGEGDSSPRSAHLVTIARVEPARDDEGEQVVGAMVEVVSWKDPEARYSFSLHGWPQPKEVAPGGTLTVYTRAGALDCAYLDGVKAPSR